MLSSHQHPLFVRICNKHEDHFHESNAAHTLQLLSNYLKLNAADSYRLNWILYKWL